MEILAAALEGLNRAETKLDQAVTRISQTGMAPSGSSGDNIDLAQAIVNLTVAKDDYGANLKALQAADELTKHTLDILA